MGTNEIIQLIYVRFLGGLTLRGGPTELSGDSLRKRKTNQESIYL